MWQIQSPNLYCHFLLFDRRPIQSSAPRLSWKVADTNYQTTISLKHTAAIAALMTRGTLSSSISVMLHPNQYQSQSQSTIITSTGCCAHSGILYTLNHTLCLVYGNSWYMDGRLWLLLHWNRIVKFHGSIGNPTHQARLRALAGALKAICSLPDFWRHR